MSTISFIGSPVSASRVSASPVLASPVLDSAVFDSPVRQRTAAPAVRLTRRGRLVIVALALAVVAALAVLLGPAVVATDQAGQAPATHAVTVQPGMTLWSIAADANPSGDVRDTIDAIVRLNSLPNGSGLQMGSTIEVPDYR